MKNLARSWDRETLTKVLTAYVILHNMVTKEKGKSICSPKYFTRLLSIQNRKIYHNLLKQISKKQFKYNNDIVDEDYNDEENDEEDDDDYYFLFSSLISMFFY
uniref:Uncharacterized protein n=1 Tax=Lactuca sativa TaxID=4236 RepID=A0A9R1XIH8_LACSA|nr:hypothetical protein LSAT_V11C400196540 [Lactuca sativa]